MFVIIMNVTFDTYAWLEYFFGTPNGRKVKKIVDSHDTVYTSTFALLELKRKYLALNEEYQTKVEFIRQRSQLVAVDESIALAAADWVHSRRLHSSDALIYATARSKRSTLLTGDPHFSGLEDVQML